MIDSKLLEMARRVRENAYSPFSKIKVGASVLTDDGMIFTGCNVENSSYGLSICAERSAIFNAVSSGKREIVKVYISTNTDGILTPCGACRQVISEFNPNAEIFCEDKNGNYKIFSIAELLPFPVKLNGTGGVIAKLSLD